MIQKKHNLTECDTKEAQSNRMSIIGEGIEGLVTKYLHTPYTPTPCIQLMFMINYGKLRIGS